MKNEKKEFILINPNLIKNPRTTYIPANFSPTKHTNNCIEVTEGMTLKNTIQDTINDSCSRHIIDALIENGSKNKLLNEVTSGLTDFLASKNKISISPENNYNMKNDGVSRNQLKNN